MSMLSWLCVCLIYKMQVLNNFFKNISPNIEMTAQIFSVTPEDGRNKIPQSRYSNTDFTCVIVSYSTWWFLVVYPAFVGLGEC